MAKKSKQSLAAAKTVAQQNVVEFLKCKRSFEYYCSHYVKIEVPGQDIFLKPYKKQMELVDLILTDHYVNVLKSRQIGISTIIQALCSWLFTFYDNVSVGIVSKDGSEATKFSRNIINIIEKLPKWMAPTFVKRTERTFVLTNGGRCNATPVAPASPDKTLRGESITFLVIDEAAFIKHIETAWTAMVPALATSQKQAKQYGVPYGTVILSTPNKTVGVGKWFFERYMRAVMAAQDENADNNIFKPFTIHWKDVHELSSDPNWYKQQCQMFDNDPKKIQQELELKFLGGEGSFFPEDVTMKLQEVQREPIQKYKIFGGETWVFEPPIKDRFYIAGVDTAPEHGVDKSAITIWDYETLNQVWEFQGKCPVKEFVKIVISGISQYPGLVVVENNSYGNQVIEELNLSDYSVMLYKEKIGNNVIRPGINTNVKTRPLMIDSLYSYIANFTEIVRSRRLALELIGLVTKNSGKVEADVGMQDDIAFSAALAFYVRKYDPPLMIEPSIIQHSSMNAIFALNEKEEEVTNASIIKDIKDDILSNQGYVDIFTMFGVNKDKRI